MSAVPLRSAKPVSTRAPTSKTRRLASPWKSRARRGRLARNDAAREAPVARRVSARIEVDVIDHARVNDRRAEGHVVEVRNANAVDEVADVPGRRAAHVKEGEPGDHRCDAGHGFDGAEGIAEGAGQLAHLGAR